MINRILPWGWRLTNTAGPSDSDALRLAQQERDRSASALRVLTEAPRSELSRSGLFVIGHARSGTTILQNALNDHREIFIFSEADFYTDPGTPDFRRRHNEMHRGFHNQENKGTYCPQFFEGDETWDNYLLALHRHYRYVGSKMVINPYDSEVAPGRLFDFATRHFYASHFIFTFRNPADVLGSYRGLVEWNGLVPPSDAAVTRSYLAVMRLYIRMLRNLPNIHVVFHDQVSARTFDELGEKLALNLDQCSRYYSDHKVKTWSPLQDEADRIVVERTMALYLELKRQAEAGYELLRIDQNTASIDPTHPTPLGLLYRQVDGLIGELDARGK
jgi:hypothetical protein